MCREHPFHSIYQLYALLSPESKRPSRRSSTSLQASQGQSISQLQRADAALTIFNELTADNDPTFSRRLKQMEALCDASVEWAGQLVKGNAVLEGERDKGTLVKKSWPVKLAKLRNIKDIDVPIMTIHTPLDPTMRYNNCITIRNFADHFRYAGGNANPKIHKCIGSDGKAYTQLVRTYVRLLCLIHQLIVTVLVQRSG